MVEVRLDPELGEHASEEGSAGENTLYGKASKRNQDDLFEGSRQVIVGYGALAKTLRIGNGALPRLAEMSHSRPELLRLSHAQTAVPNSSDQADHPVVSGCSPQRIGHIAQDDRVALHQASGHIGWWLLRHPFVEVQLQYGPSRDSPGDQPPGHQQRQNDSEQDECGDGLVKCGDHQRQNDQQQDQSPHCRQGLQDASGPHESSSIDGRVHLTADSSTLLAQDPPQPVAVDVEADLPPAVLQTVAQLVLGEFGNRVAIGPVEGS